MAITEIYSFTVEWPREIKPDDLAQIDSFRAQGMSSAASVAEFMISEAGGLRGSLVNKANRLQSRKVWDEFDPDGLIEGALISIWAYKQPAHVLLYAEETIRNGKPPFSIGDLEQEQAAIRLEYDQRVMRGRDNPVRTTTKIVTNSAEYYFRLCSLGTDLTKGTPIEVVNAWVDFAISFYKKAGLYKDVVRSHILGFKEGRDRFNQLDQAIQQEI